MQGGGKPPGLRLPRARRAMRAGRGSNKLKLLLLAYIRKQVRKALGGSNTPSQWRNHGYKGIRKPGRTGLGGR